MTPAQVAELAQRLDDAQCNARAIPQLSIGCAMHEADAYRIQRAVIQRRIQRGEQVIGLKMGFTSQAKMVQMGVSDQIVGTLTDAMQVANHGMLALDGLIHPRCEPEIAFLLRRDVAPDMGLEHIGHALEAVAPALEIIDSRYANFRFSCPDVIADNASSAAFVLGGWVTPPADLADLDVTLMVDGRVVQRGSTRDILGNPLHALVSAARLAEAAGIPLAAGSVVLAGAATAAEALTAGMAVRARVASVGEVGCSMLPRQTP